MKTFISRRFYRLFGLKKYIVVAIHKQTSVREQYIAISRKSQAAIHAIQMNLDAENYDFKAYTEVQYAHMLKLRY